MANNERCVAALLTRLPTVRVQKSITIDPASSSETLAAAPAELLDAQRQAEQLRDTASRQARELEALEARLAELTRVAEEEVSRVEGRQHEPVSC